MPFVQLKRGWPGNFRRTLKDAKGKKTEEVLEFTPGVPVEVTHNQLEALEADIGPALEIIKPGTVAERDTKAEESLKDKAEARADRKADADKQAAERRAAKTRNQPTPADAQAQADDIEQKHPKGGPASL